MTIHTCHYSYSSHIPDEIFDVLIVILYPLVWLEMCFLIHEVCICQIRILNFELHHKPETAIAQVHMRPDHTLVTWG